VNKVYLTMGDDRNVPMDDKESNFKGMNDSLISKIKIPSDHVLRIKTELGMEKAAETFEKELKRFAEKSLKGIIYSTLFLLGIGTNGHTASLFPNSAALEVTNRSGSA